VLLPLLLTVKAGTGRALAAAGPGWAVGQLAVFVAWTRSLVDQQVVLGVKEMLEAGGYELLGGEIDHDASVVEALGPDLVGAHLGVLDGAAAARAGSRGPRQPREREVNPNNLMTFVN